MEFFGNVNTDENSKWLIWKVSPEGTYLAVMPEFIPSNWNIKEIKKTLLKNKVLNFDIAKIEEVIKNASGKVEKIGPPFELFEEGKRKYLHLQVTPMQVRFSIEPAILKTDYMISEADVLFVLAEKAVTYGIDYDIIKKAVSRGIYGQEFIIAAATPPIAGEDAVITEVLPIDPDAKPYVKEDGTVDYRKLDNIKQIKQGEVICTRKPPTPGTPGVNVYGTTLSPAPGEDYALPTGINTKVIDNETKLVSAINGFVYRQERDICVGNVYVVEGDVDFKTGNIEYSGDVVVRGNVNSDFSVTADGNISIEGFVEAANITSKKGSVFLKGSVFGQNKANIVAEKNVIADNIQDSKIKVGKVFKAWRRVYGCYIEAETLEMPMDAQIISSSVYFKGYVRCGKIGGKVESISEFVYVNDEKKQFKEELQSSNELLKKLSDAMKALQSKLQSMPFTTPELKNHKQLLESQLSSCASSKEQLTSRREKLLNLIELMPDKDALISAYLIYPVLKVSIFGLNTEYKQDFSNLTISWRNGAIKMESM
ncbi:MAG: FapA family protein [Fibromonadales bacterium]|nr:FapA family protein [Fibromonadales bacterium]